MGTAGLVIAGCGGGNGNTTSGGANSAAVGPGTPTAAPPPTPVVAQIGKGTNKIVFWHGLGGADGATMQQMLKQYSSDKKDVSVESDTYGWDVFYQKFPTSIVAKTPPDMAIMHEWAIAQFASQGILQSADDLFFDAGLLPKDDFNETILKKITVDGVTQGVMFDNHGWGMYYNTKLIKEAGLDPNKLPQNGDEYVDWAIKLTTDENGKHPDEDGFNVNKVKVWGAHSTWLRPTLLSTMWQYGGGVTDDAAKKAMLDSEASVAAVQYWYDMIWKHRAAPQVTVSKWAGDYFKGNGLALMWEGSWNLNFFKDNPKIAEVTKAAPLPSLGNGGDKAAWMSAHILVVPEGVSKDKMQRTKDLIVWLSNNGRLWAQSGQVPARLTVQNSGEIDKMWSVSVYAEEFQKIGKTEPAHQSITEIQAAYEPAFTAALSKTTPLKQALTEANKTIQGILDRGGA